MERKNRGILKNKLFLYLTEFFSGMSVMAVELGASRLLAPYFSSSQIVWTIIIGTIMIAMALGNIYGGRTADKSPNPDIVKNLTKHTGELTNANLKNMMQEVTSNLTEYQKGNYILTDDQAPVELLGMQVIDELIKDEVQYYKDIYKEQGIKGLIESL